MKTIKAKSPAEIVRTLEEGIPIKNIGEGCVQVDGQWLSSSLASLIEYAITQLPEPQMFGKELSVAILERNAAIDDCISALRKIQSEIE